MAKKKMLDKTIEDQKAKQKALEWLQNTDIEGRERLHQENMEMLEICIEATNTVKNDLADYLKITRQTLYRKIVSKTWDSAELCKAYKFIKK